MDLIGFSIFQMMAKRTHHSVTSTECAPHKSTYM